MTQDIFEGAEIIHSYTRAQALEDGELVDVSAAAKEAGFVFPTAITHGAWAQCVEWTEADSRRQVHQDRSGRLWDVLSVARFAIMAARRTGASVLQFKVSCVPRGGRATRPRTVALLVHIGPGDRAEPVMTIMLPEDL